MSKSITYQELVKSGLALSKIEATRLLPHISKISQHGLDELNEVEFQSNAHNPWEHPNEVNMTAETASAHDEAEPDKDLSAKAKKSRKDNTEGANNSDIVQAEKSHDIALASEDQHGGIVEKHTKEAKKYLKKSGDLPDDLS